MTPDPSSINTTTDYIVRPRSLSRKLLHSTLHLANQTKALILLTLVLTGSLLCLLDLVPHTALADRKNPINVYFVKYSWGWTLLVIVPATFFPAVLYSGLHRVTILRHLSRLVVSHLIWMVVTSLIVVLDSSVGTCEASEVADRSVCIKKGHVWLGFDISGHVFLLTYCIYVITEECANIKLEIWYEYENTLTQENHVTDKLSERTKRSLLLMHKISSWLVEPLELLSLAFMIIWSVMVVSTSLYFHTFTEKVLGYLIAVGCWYVTYRVVYGKKYRPCKPSEGYLHPLRIL